jgi:hypothetical protein
MRHRYTTISTNDKHTQQSVHQLMPHLNYFNSFGPEEGYKALLYFINLCHEKKFERVGVIVHIYEHGLDVFRKFNNVGERFILDHEAYIGGLKFFAWSEHDFRNTPLHVVRSQVDVILCLFTSPTLVDLSMAIEKPVIYIPWGFHDVECAEKRGGQLLNDFEQERDPSMIEKIKTWRILAQQ